MSMRVSYLRPERAAFFAGAALLAPFGASAQIDFRGLGILPGAASSTTAGVSADGRVVVGMMQVDGVPPGVSDTWAVRWTFEDGAEHLAPQSPFFRATVTGVSGDGSVIVGDVSSPGHPGHTYHWTRATGFVTRSFLHTFTISDDGVFTFDQDLNFFVPRRRLRADGSSQVLGTGFVTGASSDGGVVVGSFGPFSEGAWRWTESTGQVSLGSLPAGMVLSEPLDMTPDGSVVVGRMTDGTADAPFRWTEQGGYEVLATIAGAVGGVATDTAADGRTAVGYVEWENEVRRAAIWLPEGIVYELSDYLGLLGVELEGWALSTVTGISDDGLTLAGDGVNPDGIAEGWVVRIPAPTTAAMLALFAMMQRRRRPESPTVLG